ncbi:MAG TPA: hypothetical protein VMF33_00115, partial [Acidimicrobiales bacterium]|nr:hypothetical protein [Acidimicrobiales bacterium]
MSVTSAPQSSATVPATRRRLVSGLFVALSLVAVLVALTDAPHAGRVVFWVIACLCVLCWSLAALSAMSRDSGLALLSSLVALGGGVAIVAMRVGDAHGLGAEAGWRKVAEVAALFTMAVVLHLVLALSDGQLIDRSRQFAAAAWYGVALALSVVYLTGSRALSPWPFTVGWVIALATTFPAARARYVVASARGRQRVQSVTIGATLTLTLGVIVLTLHSLVDWPLDVAPALLALGCLVPLGLAVGSTPAAEHADRVLVHLLTTLGTVAIVAGAYLLAVRGFDKAPANRSGRDLLWWAMAAAAAAAIAQLALRARFARIATSFTYGSREAPDEVVRSFGSRMTRAIP